MNKNWKFPVGVVAVLLVACSLGLAQQAGPESKPVSDSMNPSRVSAVTTNASQPQLQEHDPRYKIRESDVFDISFELSPEYNQAGVVVQPDGFITLRGLGDLKVQGETVPQLIDTLAQAYSKVLNHPIISVVLRDFQKPYFVADGQLLRPGKYELRGDITLTEGIAIAGGFLESAKHSQVLLFRKVNDEWMSAKIINVKKMEALGNLKEDPYLHPGDMLFVPKNRLSKIKPFIPNTAVGATAYNSAF